MQAKSTTAMVLVAGLILAPVARAEEAADRAAEEEYEQRYLAFEDLGTIDPDTGAFVVQTTLYQGNSKQPIGPEAFYRLVGREDLARQYREREEGRGVLMGAGIVTTLGAVIGSIVIAKGSSAPCDVSSPAYFQCAVAASEDSDSRLHTAAAVGVIGGLLGVTLFLVGLRGDANPIGLPARRELADQYNQKLRLQLGLSVIEKSDGAGLALSARF